jgi:hypothetical protein
MSDDITQWWGNIVTLTNKFFSGPRPCLSHKMTLVRPRPRIYTALKKLKTWGHLHELLRKNLLKVKKVTILPHLTVRKKRQHQHRYLTTGTVPLPFLPIKHRLEVAEAHQDIIFHTQHQ